MPQRDTKFKIVMLVPLALLSVYLLLLVGSQASFFRFNDFISQLSQPDIRSAILISLLAATISSGIAMTIAIPTAYTLARTEFPGKRVIDTLIDLPMVLTPIALGTLILMLWNSAVGQFLARLGFTQAMVHHVEKTDDGWRVSLTLGDTAAGGPEGAQRTVEADSVVLAAGTLGSSEILLRSRERGISATSNPKDRSTRRGGS